MTRVVRGARVEVELGTGTYTIRWPEVDITLGPCRAAVTTSEAGAPADRTSGDASGTWRIEPRDEHGRPGARAEWRSDDGPRVSVHVPIDDGPVVVTAAHTARASTTLERLTPVAGPTDLVPHRRLVDGYDSWAYSGVRGAEAGASSWHTALVAPDGRVLAVQALRADRTCSRISWSDGHVIVDQGAPPPQDHVAGTWGYRDAAPPGLGLRHPTGTTFTGEPVAISAGTDALAVIEDLAALAAARASARRWSGAPVHGWESWYHYGLFLSADDILTNARRLRERYHDHRAFDLVQIDDGWQVTYGAWTPNERFPADLGVLVDELRALGCRPGLWLAPFRVQPGAPGVATEHPEWCLRPPDSGPDADPWWEPAHGKWALDASHPGACAWLRDLGARVRDWGFEMVKVDFCYLGAASGTRHDPDVTGIEALRRGLGALVDGLGPDVYVLGCGMPMLPAVGLCHGNRVGHDLAMPRLLQEVGHPVDPGTEGGWTGARGVRVQARNVAARWAHHGRWYDADPEVVMAWGADGADPAGYPVEVARVMATLALVTGGPFLLADELSGITREERSVLEHPDLLALVDGRPDGSTTTFRPVDLLACADGPEVVEHAYSVGDGVPTHWVAARGTRTIHAWFNWSDAPRRIAPPPELMGRTELWTGAVVDGAGLDVPAGAVRVVATAGAPGPPG